VSVSANESDLASDGVCLASCLATSSDVPEKGEQVVRRDIRRTGITNDGGLRSALPAMNIPLCKSVSVMINQGSSDEGRRRLKFDCDAQASNT
jgi:hypothetical protein